MRKSILQVVITGIAAAVLSLLYFLYPVASNRFYPKCIFHELTGWNCPGCGSQRAASALLHGHIGEALGKNILFVASLPLIMYSAYIFCLNIVREKKVQQRFFYSPVFSRTVVVVVLAFFVLRNIPVYPFDLLAP